MDFEPGEPRTYSFYHTKNLKIYKKIWEHPWKYSFCKCGNQTFWILLQVYVPFFGRKLRVSHAYQILWTQAPENDDDPCKNSSKYWIWNSHLSKNRRWKFGNFCIFQEGNPQHPSTFRLPPLHQTGVVPSPVKDVPIFRVIFDEVFLCIWIHK